jgi:hypothetical protein
MRLITPSGLKMITIAGVLAIIAGTALWLLAPEGSSDYGWFAYAPLPQESYRPSTAMLPSGAREAGLGLVAFGAVLLSGVFGYRTGHRDALAVPAGPPVADEPEA